MLQSVPRSREAYGHQSLKEEATAAIPPEEAQFLANPRLKKNVASFPLRRRRLAALLVRKLIFQFVNDEKMRRQTIRCSLLVLPIVLLLAVAVTMFLGNWAQAQAAQSHQSGTLAAFQRQQMFHASIHVPQ
jgi:hypothetical protein